MAYFAEVNNNNIVVRVLAVNDSAVLDENNIENEQTGKEALRKFYGGAWVQTSYNTRGGVHYTNGVPSENQSKAFRKNYAGIGDTFDTAKDAFISPKPFPSWGLNEDTCFWEPPIAEPDDGKLYLWNETLYQSDNSQGWKEKEA